MIFIRVTSWEPKNGVYEFHDHGFQTELEALAFKQLAEEDGTYWGTWSMPPPKESDGSKEGK